MTKFKLISGTSVESNRYTNEETGNEYIFHQNTGTEVLKEDVDYFKKNDSVEMCMAELPAPVEAPKPKAKKPLLKKIIPKGGKK